MGLSSIGNCDKELCKEDVPDSRTSVWRSYCHTHASLTPPNILDCVSCDYGEPRELRTSSRADFWPGNYASGAAHGSCSRAVQSTAITGFTFWKRRGAPAVAPPFQDESKFAFPLCTKAKLRPVRTGGADSEQWVATIVFGQLPNMLCGPVRKTFGGKESPNVRLLGGSSGQSTLSERPRSPQTSERENVCFETN